ncbi:Vi polysaccharide biosynthesis UDP-N-acetylglucosamine C-6 dehydrogenase TviB, partial [Campylobacter fetus subsp. venerealis]
AEVNHEYGVQIMSGKKAPDLLGYSAIILAVAHKEFLTLPINKSVTQVIYDVKGYLSKDTVDARL